MAAGSIRQQDTSEWGEKWKGSTCYLIFTTEVPLSKALWWDCDCTGMNVSRAFPLSETSLSKKNISRCHLEHWQMSEGLRCAHQFETNCWFMKLDSSNSVSTSKWISGRNLIETDSSECLSAAMSSCWCGEEEVDGSWSPCGVCLFLFLCIPFVYLFVFVSLTDYTSPINVILRSRLKNTAIKSHQTLKICQIQAIKFLFLQKAEKHLIKPPNINAFKTDHILKESDKKTSFQHFAAEK